MDDLEIEQRPPPQVGDRVQRIGLEQCAMVQAVDWANERAHVLWGVRTAVEGKPGIPVEEWIPWAELEPFAYAVVTADEIAERKKAEVTREIGTQTSTTPLARAEETVVGDGNL